MADSQMSQTGPIFRKISLFDAKCFDIAPLADSDDKAVILNSAQDAGVQVEYLHRACTWFFSVKTPLAPANTWKDVLHSWLNRQKEWIGAASSITFACSYFAGQCIVTKISSLAFSNAGCPWIMQFSPNFWRSHSCRYCPEDNSMPNDTQSIPRF